MTKNQRKQETFW